MPSAQTTQTRGATHWSNDPKAGSAADAQPIMPVAALRTQARNSGPIQRANHSGTGHCAICPVQFAMSPAFPASQPASEASTAAVTVHSSANTTVTIHTRVFTQSPLKRPCLSRQHSNLPKPCGYSAYFQPGPPQKSIADLTGRERGQPFGTHLKPFSSCLRSPVDRVSSRATRSLHPQLTRKSR